MNTRRYDTTNLPDFIAKVHKSVLGGDNFINTLNGMYDMPNYPPYNLEKISTAGDDVEARYVLSIAVAGFARHHLNVQIVSEGKLSVSGTKSFDSEQLEPVYLHKGISDRNFERQFHLAEHVVVESVALKDGLLTILLKQELPESRKPKTLEIQ